MKRFKFIPFNGSDFEEDHMSWLIRDYQNEGWEVVDFKIAPDPVVNEDYEYNVIMVVAMQKEESEE